MAKLVSVVVPLFNEEEILSELLGRLKAVEETTPGFDLEVVAVNDGSADETRGRLKKLLPELSRWKLVSLSRNFGLQAAYRAGLDHASGDAVIFMDGDLQDPPELIPELVSEWKAGAKVVVACRNSRTEKGVRRICFDLFHRFFDRLTGGSMPRNSGTFGLMDRVVADHVRNLREKSLFYPALRCWAGYEQSRVYYDRDSRFAGETKQSFWRLLHYAWDGVANFSNVPIQMINFTALGVLALAFLCGTILVVQGIMHLFGLLSGLKVVGVTAIIFAMLFMSGIQLLSAGIIGSYLSRVFKEVKGRPLYFVEEFISSEEN